MRLDVSGINRPFSAFLAHGAFAFGQEAGAFMPGWEHLWFLPYLWLYTLLLAGLIALPARWRARGGRAVAWLAGGRRLIWLPGVLIAAGMALLMRAHVPALADSVDYLPAFLLGFAYAHRPALRAAFRRHFGEALALSLAMLAAIWGQMAFGSADPGRIEELLVLAANGVMSWAMVPVAFTLAECFLNRDHAWRRPLAAAVFPAYVVHQTAIVLVGWQLGRMGVVGLSAFAIQLGAVLGACFAAWLLARRFALLGILLGMPPKAARGPVAAQRLAPA